MKKRFLSAGILFMALVGMLGAMGLGYALWSKTLHIDGTVETGSVDGGFDFCFTDDDDFVDDAAKDGGDLDNCPDLPSAAYPNGIDDESQPYNQLKDGPDNDRTSCDPAASGPDPKLREDKDVARCDCLVDPDDQQKATIHKLNVYPSYYCTTWFDIHNKGTVPVKIDEVLVDGVPVTPSVPEPFDLDGDMLPDVEIHVTDVSICQQIDADEYAQMDIDQHILQDAPEEANLSYTVEVKLVQWNESTVNCP